MLKLLCLLRIHDLEFIRCKPFGFTWTDVLYRCRRCGMLVSRRIDGQFCTHDTYKS